MKHLIRAFMLSVVTLTYASITLANNDTYIKLQLDSREVFSGDTVVLDVESTGLLDPIDFSLIEQNTTLLRETTGTRIAVVDGKVQEIAIRRMDLQPKQSGILVIGPLIAGDIVSNTVHIKVLDATRPDWTPDQSDAQIITSLTPDNAAVNQQMLFKVELLHRYPINSESIKLPNLAGFSKRALIESRRTYKDDTKEWFRTEWQTLVYPRKSGSMEIGPIEWSGTLAKSNIERADFIRRSDPMKISIESVPTDASAWWLPATSVLLTETWSSPPTELRAGDELERTITVQATNVLAGQIPTPAVPESRALIQTLINATRQETLTKKGVIATADFVYRVTAQSPIPVFLDTVRIPWWDTQQQSSREAIIPARRINVGLPDRADVLSKLALEESGISRIKFKLQTINPLRLLSYCAATIAIFYLLLRTIPFIWRRLRYRARLNRHLKHLKTVARQQNAQELYRILKTTHSRRLLQGSEQDLVLRLESCLFSDHIEQNDHPLSDWLKPVISRTKKRRVSVSSMSGDALADL